MIHGRRSLNVVRLMTFGIFMSIATSTSAAPRAKPPASAPASDDAAIEEAAKARYKEGTRLYGKKKYEEARAAFLQAIALKRRPAAMFMLAQSALQSGRWLEALKSFDAYLAEEQDVPTKVMIAVNDGKLTAHNHLGRVRFDVPDDAEVTIDGEKVASFAAPIDVLPGRHAIVITHLHDKKAMDVDAQAGAIVDVKPVFVPKALVPTSDTRTRPTPATPPPPPSTDPDANPSESSSSSSSSSSILAPPITTWPVYVAGAIGLVGLGAAAIFGGLAENAHHASDVARDTLVRAGKTTAVCATPDPGDFTDACVTIAHNDSVVKGHVAAFQTSLVIGISGTVAAVGWFLLAPKEGSGEHPPSLPPPTTNNNSINNVRVTPWIGVTSGGAAFEGRF